MPWRRWWTAAMWLVPWPCGLRPRSSGPARGAAPCWATWICCAPGGRWWRRTCWRPGRPTTLPPNRWWERTRPRGWRHTCARCGGVGEAHRGRGGRADDPAAEPLVGADAATWLAAYLCTVRRVEEALSWSERAVAASAGDPAARLQALIMTAQSLTLAGRGPEGLARLGGLPAAAAEVPLAATDGLVMRGVCPLFTDDKTG